MMIDRVDGRDHVIGSIERSDVFRLQANFRVVHVLVKNRAGHVLLQKIAPKLRHPGMWGSSVAGYVASGETYDRAAVRKVEEELGIEAARVKRLGRTSMTDDGCRKFITVYELRHDGPFVFAPDRVAGLEFVSLAEMKRSLAKGDRLFTPTFTEVIRYVLKRGSLGRRSNA